MPAALTFKTQITGFPKFFTLAKASASSRCGPSSVIKNKIKSAYFAASKAIFSSSSPPSLAAAIPGTSTTLSPVSFHTYSRTSRVVR